MILRAASICCSNSGSTVVLGDPAAAADPAVDDLVERMRTEPRRLPAPGVAGTAGVRAAEGQSRGVG